MEFELIQRISWEYSNDTYIKFYRNKYIPSLIFVKAFLKSGLNIMIPSIIQEELRPSSTIVIPLTFSSSNSVNHLIILPDGSIKYIGNEPNHNTGVQIYFII